MCAHDTSPGERAADDDCLPLPPPYVPGLTILDHPDRRRVGQKTALPKLALGDEVRLSRLEPAFAAPGRPVAAPLADLHLSLQPIWLLPGREPGTVVLDCSGTRTPVEADGLPVEQGRAFTAAELARGVGAAPGPPGGAGPPLDAVGGLPVLVPLRPGRRERRHRARVRQEIQQAAILDVPVLLRGETGTGKDLVARAIHESGPRRAYPFVAGHASTALTRRLGLRRRPRRLHRCRPRQGRLLPARPARHALPGRDRRGADRGAGAPAAGA